MDIWAQIATNQHFLRLKFLEHLGRKSIMGENGKRDLRGMNFCP
jgi:hypothetical protein